MKLLKRILFFMSYLTFYADDDGAGAGGDGDSGGAGDGTSPTDWQVGMDDGDKEYLANRGWDGNPSQILNSYRELEKFKGYSEAEVLRIPDLATASPDEMSSIFNKLGRPENAEGYELPDGKSDTEIEFKGWLQGVLHEMNAPKASGQIFLDRLIERQELMTSGADEQQALQIADDKAALRTKWGEAHDVQLRAAQNAAATFGITSDEINTLQDSVGFMPVMEMFSKIAKGLGEDNYISGEGAGANFGGVMTPDQANDKISKLHGDPNWSKRYLAGDTAALNEMSRLQRYAAGGI